MALTARHRKSALAQQPVQTLIEGVAGGSGKASRFDPRLLLLIWPAFAQ